MKNPDKISGSYWDILRSAETLLNMGDFSGAERHLEVASEKREESPGRVFFSEKISDGLGRLFKRGQDHSIDDQAEASGRWLRHHQEFRQKFLALGDQTVRQAVHLSELRPEDDAETNQPILERALYLVGRSRLFAEEPASAIPLLKGLFRVAKRTGWPFSVELIRYDLPLTEEDRLWLARRGGELVEEFQEQGAMTKGSRQAEEWARVCLQLLNPMYFGQTGRLEEERSWVEAMTSDHLLGRAAESVEAYRKYLVEYPVPGERADEARIRLLELLANIDGLHFPVPHYDEALSAMQSAGLSVGSAMSGRFEAALARIEHRCPDPEPGSTGHFSWASLALEPDGAVSAISWWQNEPRDVAFWRPGEDSLAMENFLRTCEGRIICQSSNVHAAIEGAWSESPAVWTVQDFCLALLEGHLPEDGLQAEALLRIGMGETSEWRAGWNPDHGHPYLEPPRRSTLAEAWQGGPAGTSLSAGLLLLAIKTRLSQADPCLRAGIRHMARRGDQASQFLYEFLTVGQNATNEVDSSFEPWTLPLLWTRPDPFGWSSASGIDPEGSLPVADTLARPDLGRNDLAIVSTGDPSAVVAAWGDGRQKWRIVLDRPERLEGLSRVAGGAIGPVTLIPPNGRVHNLDRALEMLDELLGTKETTSHQAQWNDAVKGLLPLFHWSRLVETHNGDLLDFLQVRPRLETNIPLYEDYVQLVEDLPFEEPTLEDSTLSETWAGQFSQRVRKAGFVAGMVDNLVAEPDRLDSLWGVFEGSAASWVFLDSASIHWSLLGRETAGIQQLHALLCSRGNRHLSLLTGAVWLRAELEELLGTWLKVYGTPYCVGLTDGRPPRLRMVDQGIVPDSRLDSMLALSGQIAHARQVIPGDETGTVLLPSEGLAAQFWREIAQDNLSLGGENWTYLRPVRQPTVESWTSPGVHSVQQISAAGRKTLLVPVLASLEGGECPIAQADTPEEWASADSDRAAFLNWRRKLCGLEIASLMAGAWQNVEIMDPRWWRLLRPQVTDSNNYSFLKNWNGQQGAALVACDGCSTFNLPGIGDKQGDALPSAIIDSVDHWLSSLPMDAPASALAHLPVKASWKPARGPCLLVGDATVEWSAMTQLVGRQWESGNLSNWNLLVADHLPGPTTDLISSSWTQGLSAWHENSEALTAQPVVWVRKSEFSNPMFVEYLKDNPPFGIMACGVQQWLPTKEKGLQVGAHALRILLDCGAQGVVLQADEMAAPWGQFIMSTSGANSLDGSGHLLPLAEFPADHAFAGDQETLLRLRQLLNRLELVLPGGHESDTAEDNAPRSMVSARQLVSVHWLARLAGVQEEAIRQGVRILRWAGRLQGDSLSAAAGQLLGPTHRSQTHALLIPRRFAEIEHILKRLEDHLPVLFPLLLGQHRPGLSTWIDLAFPPLESDASDLQLLDCYLAMVTDEVVPGLSYDSPHGFMHSSRRLLACSGNPAEMVAQLVQSLKLFRERVQDVMSGAVETADGFLVETGLNDLRDEERDFLSTGAAMGLWRWLGPVDELSLHLVDLLTLAESPTVRNGESAWKLLSDLAESRTLETGTGAASSSTGSKEESSGWGLAGLKNLLPRQARSEEFTDAIGRMKQLTSTTGKPGQLILKGRMGSGRHQALAEALRSHYEDLEVVVYCPDYESAAVLQEAVGPVVQGHFLDIRVAEKGITPAAPKKFEGHLGESPDSIIIMCEVQRFEKETRYRIAQMGRDRKLIMTVDEVASEEPWENLFLTTPRIEQILKLDQPRRPARRLWSELAKLMPEDVRPERESLRSEKGDLQADYAVNLDHCLARLVLDVESRELPDRLRLVGPLLSDLDFLAESIRQRGWLAISEKTLSPLLLPGIREIMAAATDLLSQGLNKNGQESQNGGDSDFEDTDAGDNHVEGSTLQPVLLTPQLLPESQVESWRQWHLANDWDLSSMTMDEFFKCLETEDWARSVLSYSHATSRVRQLMNAWSNETVAVVADTTLWEAWWLTMLSHLQMPIPDERRPLITLAESSDPAGLYAPGGMYLCLGTEDWQRHYNVLARVTDRGLILFKDRSPLDQEELPPG